MPSLINHPDATNFTYRFRAYCRDDNFLAKWRTTEAAAKEDAATHKAKSGNSGHTVEIEVEQKYTVQLND